MQTLQDLAQIGMVSGIVVAVSPFVVVRSFTAVNIPRAIITGLFLRILTNGKWDYAFNVIMTSPSFWRVQLMAGKIGCAITVISSLGFVLAKIGFCINRKWFASAD